MEKHPLALPVEKPKENRTTNFGMKKPVKRCTTGATTKKCSCKPAGFDRKVTAGGQIQAQRQPRQILRTIVLPNEQINTLQVEVEKLRKLNEEQRALFEQEIVGLKEDRRAREEEMRIKYVDRIHLGW